MTSRRHQLQFFVPGIPATAGSKRGFPVRRRDGRVGVAMAPDCARSRPWMFRIAAAGYQTMSNADRHLLDGPLELELTFYLLRPRGHFGTGRNAERLRDSAPPWPTDKPDLSKLVRAVEDGLTGIAWRDDSQVVATTATKRYADDGQTPGVEVSVMLLDKRTTTSMSACEANRSTQLRGRDR